MIILKKLRLVNWYGFGNITVPIGNFTLIAGKNGNGKSVMLDAIKYAAYGDTVFNKSSDSKGSRTILSYTRGLLDATAKTYMRPADKSPNVYTHIALEFSNIDGKGKKDCTFILGVVIETGSTNNCQTYRYAIDKKSLSDIEHTYKKDNMILPYSALELSKKYRLALENSERGIVKFSQMMGLKLTLEYNKSYLRKLRSIMTYDPTAKIDRFIRESVLEAKLVDFKKLIEAKENINKLNDTFQRIQKEINDLESILKEYDLYENAQNRLIVDDIKIIYVDKLRLETNIEQCTNKINSAIVQKTETENKLQDLKNDYEILMGRLNQAQLNLMNLDSARAIQNVKGKLETLKKDKEQWYRKFLDLENFQRKISEILNDNTFNMTGKQKDILISLLNDTYSSTIKADAVSLLKIAMDKYHDEQVGISACLKNEIKELENKISKQNNILVECKKHRNNYQYIPEYVGLRDEINRAFEKQKISAKAQFACEYVISVKDEAWQNAIESFLGARRYTILVPPEYYDIADDILNNSKYKYAHLFNTKLLMRKEIFPVKDSVVNFLEIKNSVAQRYFAYHLGRIHAVKLEEVRNFENAITREGRISVNMDSYFLRFDRIHSYYLGQKIFELNRKRAEDEIKRLQAQRQEKVAIKYDLGKIINRIREDRNFFRPYDYDASQEYQKAERLYEETQERLEKLENAQNNNKEYQELNLLVEILKKESDVVNKEKTIRENDKTNLERDIEQCKQKIEEDSNKLININNKFNDYKINKYTLTQKAVEAYDKYINNGKQGIGGLLQEKSRQKLNSEKEKHNNALISQQAKYNAIHSELNMTEEGAKNRQIYEDRKKHIWIDDLQDIQEKLKHQTRRYEEIFKNEFVLTILTYCEKSQEDLKKINRELSNLQFSSKYQFDVHYVNDSSDYAKIIRYAKAIKEREENGLTNGQIMLDSLDFNTISESELKTLEEDIKSIITKIIKKNSEEIIANFADYRNYMTYEILISNKILKNGKLSKQTGFNSGAEVQIPYILILSSALLLIYNQHINSTRLVFIDEPFAKMDPGNVKLMLDFMRKQNLQVIFCSPDKTESIGEECDVILPVLRVQRNNMQIGIVKFREERAYGKL